MLFTLIFSLVPIFLISLWAVYENDRNTDDLIRENLGTISAIQIDNIYEFAESRNAQLGSIAGYGLVQDAVLNSLNSGMSNNEAADYLDNLLAEEKNNSKYVESISVININYKNVASSEPYNRGEKSSLEGTKEEYLSGEFAIGRVYIRPTDSGRTIRVVPAYKGIYDRDNELIGYVVAEIPASFFDTRISAVMKENIYIRILDENGEVVNSDGDIFNEQYFGNISENELLNYSRKWELIDWDNETSGSFEYTAAGNTFIAYYSTVPYSEWKIQVISGLSVYRGKSLAFAERLLAGMVFLAIILILADISISRKVTKPLVDIQNVLNNVQRNNDYSLRVNIGDGQGELSQLSGDIDRLLAYVEEVDSKQQERNMQLSRRADKDPLTGIFNKEAIAKYIEWMLGEQPSDEEVAVGFVDIDNFRDYNTKYGHSEGDRVIKFVANNLKNVFGKGVGRNGGDEFLFMVTLQDRDKLEMQVQSFIEAVHSGITIEGESERVRINCCIGVVTARVGDSTREMLVTKADEAMYVSKDKGKDGYTIM